MSDYDARRERIDSKKIAQNQREMFKRCHCGKLRVNHLNRAEAKKCERLAETQPLVRRMTDEEIQDMEPSKI